MQISVAQYPAVSESGQIRNFQYVSWYQQLPWARPKFLIYFDGYTLEDLSWFFGFMSGNSDFLIISRLRTEDKSAPHYLSCDSIPGLTQCPSPVDAEIRTPFSSARRGAPATTVAQPVASASDAPAAATMGPGPCRGTTPSLLSPSYSQQSLPGHMVSKDREIFPIRLGHRISLHWSPLCSSPTWTPRNLMSPSLVIYLFVEVSRAMVSSH